MYQKFNDFIVFDPPDISDYIVGYRELGGEYRSTIKSLTDVVKKFAAPAMPHTIFVNPSGNDSSLGNSEAFAFRTIKRAMAQALQISRDLPPSSFQFENANGWGTASNPVNVFVRAGNYVEDNPIYVPPGVTIVGENVKSVIVIPKNKFYDIFWINNKTSIQNISFTDYFSPAYAIAFPELKQLKGEQVVGQPSTRIVEATAKAYEYYNIDYNKYPSTKKAKSSFLNFSIDAGEPIFDPFNIAFLGKYFKNFDGNETFFTSEELVTQKEFWQSKYFNLSSGVERPYILNSPYIYNCSANTLPISANTYNAGGTIYADGDMVDGPLRSMQINSCEHFNQGGRGICATNNALLYVKDNITKCCTEAILSLNGGTCIVDDSVCSFGLSGLVSVGKSLQPTMVGMLKNDFYSTETSNKFTITNLGSEYSLENQKDLKLKKPYVGQVFQIIDKNYLMLTSGINYLSATNSGTYFAVQSASELRPASLPYEGYECDVIIENLYSINNDTSITSNTFTSPIERLNYNSDVLFYTRSAILAHSHVFDNVGTGTNYLSATIQSGAIGNEKLETNKDKVGIILYNSQNQSGFIKFGDNVKINQINGKIDSKTNSTENTITNTLTSYSDVNFGTFKHIDQQGRNSLLKLTRNSDDSIISIESINDSGGGNNVRSFYARGSTSLKKALSANDNIVRITGFAHNGTNYPAYGVGGNVSLRFEAAGDQSAANAGAYMSFWTTKKDSIGIETTLERMRIADNGFVGINTTAPLSTLHVQGGAYISNGVAIAGESKLENLMVNSLTALSAYFDVINIKQYEISGFDVKGDFQIDGNTGFGVEPNSENRLTIFGNVSSVGDFNLDGNLSLSEKLISDQSYFNSSEIINLKNVNLSSYSLTADYLFSNNSLINELSTYSLSSYVANFAENFSLSSYNDYLFSNYILNNRIDTLTLSALSSNIYSAYVEKLSTNDFYIKNLNVYGMTLNYLSALSADIGSTSSFSVSGIIYTNNGNSSDWNSTYLTVSALSALWSDESGDVSKLYVDSKFQTISGNTYTKNLTVSLPDGKTFGRYVDGEEIPAIGKTPYDIISMAIVEPIPPIVNLTSPTTVQFNQTNISNVLNYNYTIKSLGASVASLSLEYRRNNSGAWTVLETATNTPGSFTHTLTDTNFNTQPFNYRLTVTDTVGGTKTVILNITPAAYVAPTITSPSLVGVTLTSPETSTSREKGNVNTNISGSITRNSFYVNLVSYQLQYQVNGGSWNDIGSAISISGGSYSIPSTNHNPTSDNGANSISYRVKVIDEFQTTNSNSTTINFYNIIFYGPSASAPATSANVRALPKRIFTNGTNPFNLETGRTNNIFTVAMPSSLSLTQVLDLDALNANITSNYVLNGSLTTIQDYAGNNTNYKVYTMVNALPYTDKPEPGHRHQVTRG